MLSIALPKNSSFEKFIKTLKVNVWAMNKMAQDMMFRMIPVATEASSKVAETDLVVVDTKPKLRIAKTIMPDNRLDFNETFQHIRYGLDDFYKEKNPIYSNTAKAILENANASTELKNENVSDAAPKKRYSLDDFYRENHPMYWNPELAKKYSRSI